eukprot:TRINITY_DN26792_c0_g1_i1.p1 TRINITY_DN26792_c0_g1~~TRINITY_DN26792_c0_g1_i1.p1  ORF type:complete len:442 (+),score=82.25 TRINITY_DN26792_c0_g1_i1:146-1471(+)
MVGCHGGGDRPLKVCLRRATESGSIAEVQKELLAPLIEASHEPDGRREIMGHLRECLSEPSGKRWRRVCAGLSLVDRLLTEGSRALAIETAHGHHFDLVQKVSLLEYFDNASGASDPQAQQTVRERAAASRAMIVPLLQQASLEELPLNAGLLSRGDSSSNCSAQLSIGTGSTAASSSTCSAGSSSTSSATEPHSPIDDDDGEEYDSLARLESHLRRITSSGAVNIPRSLLAPVVEAARDPDGRRVVLEHVTDCFRDPLPRQWRRIIGGLSVLQSLTQYSSVAALRDRLPGLCLSLERQLWSLEDFEFRRDRRVQRLVQKKAAALREKFVCDDLLAPSSGKFADNSVAFADAFVELSAWAEASEEERSSSSEEDFDPATADIESDAEVVDVDTRVARTVSGERDPRRCDSSEACETEQFYTPMQFPAVPLCSTRGVRVLSL